MGFSSKSLAYTICRVAFGAAFVWAAWAKLSDPAAFARAIANYDLLPHGWIGFSAVVLPWIEMTCGILLAAGVWVPGNALVLNTLLAIFTAALAISLARGLDVACGCFSLDPETGGSLWRDLFRDVVMLGVGMWLMIRPLRSDNEPSEKIF